MYPLSVLKKLKRFLHTGNVAFDQVDSPTFREMMLCPPEGLEQAGCLPALST